MPYQGGGQVFQIDPSYFGLYGLGDSAKGLGQTISESKRRKMEELLTYVSMMQKAGASPEDIAAEIARRTGGDVDFKPEMTSERLTEQERRYLLTAPEDALSPDQIATKTALISGGNVAPGAARASAQQQPVIGAQQIAAGEQALKVGTLEYTKAMADMAKTFSEQFEPATAKKLTDALGPVGAQFANGRSVTQADIDKAFVSYLSGDPKTLAEYFTLRSSGKYGGFAQGKAEEKAGLAATRQGTATDAARQRNLDAETAQRNAAAAAAGAEAEAATTKAKIEVGKPVLETLMKYGGGKINLPVALAWMFGEGGLSEEDQKNINVALDLYVQSQGGADKFGEAATVLNAVSTAVRSGLPVSGQTTMAALAAITSRATGKQYTYAVSAKGKGPLGIGRMVNMLEPEYTLVEVPQTGAVGAATPSDDPRYIRLRDSIKKTIDDGVVSSATLWEESDKLPDGPEKAMTIQALNEVAPRAPVVVTPTTMPAPGQEPAVTLPPEASSTAAPTGPTRSAAEQLTTSEGRTRAQIQADIDKVMKERETLRSTKWSSVPGVTAISRKARLNAIPSEIQKLRIELRGANR